ncbi:MAG TPA: hypothetical protein VKA27_11040 [Sunxiuqinia sp.]|nr:hypothetical protein [Sunxiuqinia sp.]
MSKNLSDNFNELSEITKKYIQARIDLVKLSFLEKATHVTAYLIDSLVLILLIALIILFALAAFVAWYGQTYHDYLTGLLIAIGILVVITVLFLLFKKRIVTSAVLRGYSSMLFDEEEKKKEEL